MRYRFRIFLRFHGGCQGYFDAKLLILYSHAVLCPHNSRLCSYYDQKLWSLMIFQEFFCICFGLFCIVTPLLTVPDEINKTVEVRIPDLDLVKSYILNESTFLMVFVLLLAFYFGSGAKNFSLSSKERARAAWYLSNFSSIFKFSFLLGFDWVWP